MRVDLIVATYNEPRWLELVLWGYVVQTRRDFGILVADDGSGAETRRTVERVAAESGREIRHLWHEDRGFRKCEILNRAVSASDADYLIFTDGDCIPRNDLVETHLRLAEPGWFLSGGALRLNREASHAITPDDVRSGRCMELSWLRAHGYRPGRRGLRLTRARWLAAALDRATTTKRTWNGGNASVWREAIVAANGFDMEMEYWAEDTAFGIRLQHLGYRSRQIRNRAVALHLEHERPYVREEGVRRNREILQRIRERREVRAPRGLSELEGTATLNRIGEGTPR